MSQSLASNPKVAEESFAVLVFCLAGIGGAVAGVANRTIIRLKIVIEYSVWTAIVNALSVHRGGSSSATGARDRRRGAGTTASTP